MRLNDVDKSLEIVEQAKKHNTERQRKYMQFTRANDPEFMEILRKAKSEYFQRNKTEIVETQKMKYENDPEFHEKMKVYQREYKRVYRMRKKWSNQIQVRLVAQRMMRQMLQIKCVCLLYILYFYRNKKHIHYIYA